MYKFRQGDWQTPSNIVAQTFICWNCNKEIASEKAYRSYDSSARDYLSFIYLCPFCNAPIIIDDNKKEALLPLPGKEIEKLPENIKVVYSEIRKCMQSGCFNGAIMLMRKLIMHIAVEEGDVDGKKFEQYIDFLCSNGIVPKKSKNKADSVRKLGNSTNHEVENRTLEEAKNCFEFIELLLRVNYEFADIMETKNE
jgi:hypothetical protein